MITDFPFFSIIIPVYNAKLYITKSLESIISQTYNNFELIIIDDGSIDDSPLFIDLFFKNKNFQEYKIFKKENGGAGTARNYGIEKAIGQFFVFLDSDDYLDSDFLEKAHSTIVNDNCDLLFVDIIREKKNGEIIRFEKMSVYNKLSKQSFIEKQLTGSIPWGGVRKIASRELIYASNARFGSIKVGEESIYSFKLLNDSQKYSFLMDVYYHYVVNSASLSSTDSPENPIIVYNFIYNHFYDSGLLNSYSTTINALALTTVVIEINLFAKMYSFFKARKHSLEVLKKFRPQIRKKINANALEKRVKCCIPFLKVGFVFPVILASYIMNHLRRRK